MAARIAYRRLPLLARSHVLCTYSSRSISHTASSFNTTNNDNTYNNQKDENNSSSQSQKQQSSFTVMEMAFGTILGLGFLGLGGVGYMAYYKWDVLRKIENSFEPGYDPVLELGTVSRTSSSHPTLGHDDEGVHIRRPEQDLIDDIINGKDTGHYYLLLGPKGAGKTSMVIDAMIRNEATGVSMCDAHENPEIFRLRFGKCIDFEFLEDWYGGLFQRKEPRDAGPLLDLERAMNKLEKVAIRYRRKHGRPLCLVFNNIHFFHDDEEGWELIHLLQQRAESWAASGVLTMIFSSDDRWIYDRMKKNGSRMDVVSVGDLDGIDATTAVVAARKRLFNEHGSHVIENARDLYRLVGGRLSILFSMVKHQNMIKAAEDLISREKSWINSHVGLIEDCDDDVMDEQKFSSSAWLLFAEFVRKAEELEKRGVDIANEQDGRPCLYDVSVDYAEARQIMTRADFLLPLDHLNLITIDVNHRVRPESIMLLNAMREVVKEERFKEKLDNVLDRIAAIESLGRTRELTWKMGPEEGAIARIKIEK